MSQIHSNKLYINHIWTHTSIVYFSLFYSIRSNDSIFISNLFYCIFLSILIRIKPYCWVKIRYTHRENSTLWRGRLGGWLKLSNQFFVNSMNLCAEMLCKTRWTFSIFSLGSLFTLWLNYITICASTIGYAVVYRRCCCCCCHCCYYDCYPIPQY